MLARRLARLPAHDIGTGTVVLEGGTFGARLRGLAWLRAEELPHGHGLLLLPCSSVHTFGMRFPIDVVFADEEGSVVRIVRALPPRRLARCRGAVAALEAHAGEVDRFLSGAVSPLRPRAARA